MRSYEEIESSSSRRELCDWLGFRGKARNRSKRAEGRFGAWHSSAPARWWCPATRRDDRVGPLDGGEPRILLGHEGGVTSLAVSPDNRWIASGGQDGTIRSWPMPDLSKPPLHTIPYRELLAKLHDQTNLLAVLDPILVTGEGSKQAHPLAGTGAGVERSVTAIDVSR